jgi:hypothetical protein
LINVKNTNHTASNELPCICWQFDHIIDIVPERTVPLTLPWDETFDIGSDTGTPVDDHDYQVPFAFNGKIDKLTFAIEPPKLTDDDKTKLQEAYRAVQDAN